MNAALRHVGQTVHEAKKLADGAQIAHNALHPGLQWFVSIQDQMVQLHDAIVLHAAVVCLLCEGEDFGGW